MNNRLVLASIIVGIFAPLLAAALTDDTPPAGTVYCPHLVSTFQRGARDATTLPPGQVTELQKFLVDYYDLNPDDYVTGFFGRLTQANVQRFQQEQRLPSYGIVGSLTRAAIARVCGTQTTPPLTQPSPPPNPPPPSPASDVFRVKDYGAKCDATGDDTAAIQAAENAREAAGGSTLSFPLGFCNIAGTIFIRRAGTIEGLGHGATGSEATASVIRSISPTADAFIVITPEAVTFRNLQIDSGSVAKSQGSAILVQPSVPPYGRVLNRQSRFQDVTIHQFANGIALYNVADFNITGATIIDYHNNGIYVNNGAAVDAGHSLISGSTIWDLTVSEGAAGLRLDPAANVNVVGNKLLGGKRGVWLTVSEGPTGTFTMSNNSLEEFTVSGVYIEQSVPGKKYANVIITSNQFGNSTIGFQSAITIAQGLDPYLSNVTIANNITQIGLERDAQFVINDGNGVSVTGNVLDNLGHAGAWGIMTGGNATNVTISANVFSRMPKGNYGPLSAGTTVH